MASHHELLSNLLRGEPDLDKVLPSPKGIQVIQRLSSSISKFFSPRNVVDPLSIAFMVQQASPVAHLFQSNQAPTEIEIALIQETIRLAETVDRPDGSEPSKDVITLADELKRAHIALLSPLRRLPPEILGLIFEAVIVYPHFYSPPHLSQVCHSWREVAMSTPSLWKTIALNLRTPGPVNGFPSIPAQVSILDLRLQRARNSKIHVLLDVSELSHAEHPAFQKILDCSDRWHQAWISLPTSVIPLIDRIKGHLNALHALTLKVPGEEPFEVFQDVPLLRHVVIDAAQRPSLPWSQLESFEERNCIIVAKQRKIGLLASASTLQICWPRSLIIPTGFICTNLETLHVSFVSEAAHLNFFIRIQAPKLKELRVEKVSLDISQDISVMIRRGPSPCLLQRLMLNHVFFTPTPLTTLLCLLPELEELHINLPHRSNLQKFIFDPTIDVAPFVPKLRKLLLRVHSIQGYEDIIAQVVSSRCEALSTSTTGLQGTRPVIIILQFRHNSTRLRELKLLEGSLKDMPEAPKALLYQTAILETALCSRASIKEQRKAINKNFSSLMSSQIHVHHIYSSGIHLILKQFITRTPEGLLLEKKTELHDRANSILNRWEDRLIQDIPNRQWGPAPNNSLVYVSMKDDIRSNNPRLFVYGHPHAKH